MESYVSRSSIYGQFKFTECFGVGLIIRPKVQELVRLIDGFTSHTIDHGLIIGIETK